MLKLYKILDAIVCSIELFFTISSPRRPEICQSRRDEWARSIGTRVVAPLLFDQRLNGIARDSVITWFRITSEIHPLVPVILR